jgi:hypothetical protein
MAMVGAIDVTAPSLGLPGDVTAQLSAPDELLAAAGRASRSAADTTAVHSPPEDLIAAASERPPAEASEWQATYDEYIRAKKECGEPTEGLTFEKFSETLRRQRDEIRAKHNCKGVTFSISMKDGKATLKAALIK